MSKPHKSNRGFASMPAEKQREIAKKGGETVSKDVEHMRRIGRIGGSRRTKKEAPANA